MVPATPVLLRRDGYNRSGTTARGCEALFEHAGNCVDECHCKDILIDA